MARLIKELRRRSIIRAGVTYVVASWVLLQVVDLLAPALNLPDSATRITLYALLIGFPIAMGLFFGSIISGVGSSKDTKIDIACVDEDQTLATCCGRAGIARA